jgi:hypothetical protein
MSINSIFITESINNKKSIKNLEEKVNQLNISLKEIDQKIDIIINILNKDVKDKCNKMGEHIDFIENVYDNVKNPLGYLCNKLNSITDTSNYSLEDFESEEDDDFILDENEDGEYKKNYAEV